MLNLFSFLTPSVLLILTNSPTSPEVKDPKVDPGHRALAPTKGESIPQLYTVIRLRKITLNRIQFPFLPPKAQIDRLDVR